MRRIPLILILLLYCGGESKDKISTVSNDTDIEVLFTRSGDPVLERIVSLLNSAQKSIYMAMYELDLPDVVKSLIDAKKRGVKVEVVMDDRMKDKWAAKKLISEGIPIVFDNREPYMHNKFIIIDSAVVITGSANLKESCIYRNDNNVVIIYSRLIAENYIKEFEEMFEYKKFGALSPRNTDCCFNIGNYRVEIYFSPEDDVEGRIIKLINEARKSIKFAAFSFTNNEIGDALIYAKKRGVDVVGVIEKKGLKDRGSEYDKFIRNGITVLPDGNPYNMHSKYIIIDDSIVITGSYNFSRNAQRFNDENVLIIFSRRIAKEYSKNFDKIYQDAKL